MAFAYMTLLRLAWQFFFYLQTDLYYVIVTVLGCVDLQGTARLVLRERLGRVLRRPVSSAPLASAHPRDTRSPAGTSWLLLVGWTASIAILIAGVIPAAARILATVSGRFFGSGPHGAADLADSIVFVLLNLAQLAVLAAFVRRDRDRRVGPRSRHARTVN